MCGESVPFTFFTFREFTDKTRVSLFWIGMFYKPTFNQNVESCFCEFENFNFFSYNLNFKGIGNTKKKDSRCLQQEDPIYQTITFEREW